MTETIREFVVALGFEVDSGGQARFESALVKGVTLANLLSSALETMASRSIHAFTQFVGGFEKLSDLSRRSGQSVESIRAFQFAMSQLGATTEDATAAVQALIAAREKYGSANFAAMLKNSLGVDANSPKLFEDIAKAIAGMDQAQAHARLSWLGFNDATIQALRQTGDAIALQEKYREVVKKTGVDMEAGATGAKKLMQAWRETSMILETIVTKAFIRFAGPDGATSHLKAFNDWLEAHSSDIADALDRIGKDLLSVAEKAIDFLSKKGNWEDFKETVNHVATAVEALAVQLGRVFDYLEKIGLVMRSLPGPVAGGWLGGGPDSLVGKMIPHLQGGGGGDASPAAPPESAPSGPQSWWGRAKEWWGRTMPEALGGNPRAHAGGGGAGASGNQPDPVIVSAIDKATEGNPGLRKMMMGSYAGESSHVPGHYDTNLNGEESYGPFQLNRRGGLGVDFERDTGLSLKDPSTIPAQAAWVAKHLREHPSDISKFHGYADRGRAMVESGWGSGAGAGAGTPGGHVAASGPAGHIGGTLDMEGQQYRFGSGGSPGHPHIPYGSYPVTPNTIGAWGQAHGALGINNNQIWDAELGRMRGGIEFHSGSSDALITQGCMAIAGDQWPAFKSHVLDMIHRHGSVSLNVGPNGASVTPTGRGGAGAVAGGPRGTARPSFSLPSFASSAAAATPPLSHEQPRSIRHGDTNIHHSPTVHVNGSGGGEDTTRDVNWALSLGHRRLMSDLARNLPNNAAQ
jgi:hypothetical protein